MEPVHQVPEANAKPSDKPSALQTLKPPDSARSYLCHVRHSTAAMAGNGKKKKRVRRLPEGGRPAALRDWLTQAWALGNTPLAPSIYSSLSLAAYMNNRRCGPLNRCESPQRVGRHHIMLAPDSSVRGLLDTMTGARSALSMLTPTASRQHIAASFLEVSRSQASPHRFGANFSHVKSPSALEPLMLLAAVDVRVMQEEVFIYRHFANRSTILKYARYCSENSVCMVSGWTGMGLWVSVGRETAVFWWPTCSSQETRFSTTKSSRPSSRIRRRSAGFQGWQCMTVRSGRCCCRRLVLVDDMAGRGQDGGSGCDPPSTRTGEGSNIVVQTASSPVSERLNCHAVLWRRRLQCLSYLGHPCSLSQLRVPSCRGLARSHSEPSAFAMTMFLVLNPANPHSDVDSDLPTKPDAPRQIPS